MTFPCEDISFLQYEIIIYSKDITLSVHVFIHIYYSLLCVIYFEAKIYKAVLSDQTNGNGYAILSAISQNALRICRDMYMRPDTYAYYEETLKVQLADIIKDNL